MRGRSAKKPFSPWYRIYIAGLPLEEMLRVQPNLTSLHLSGQFSPGKSLLGGKRLEQHIFSQTLYLRPKPFGPMPAMLMPCQWVTQGVKRNGLYRVFAVLAESGYVLGADVGGGWGGGLGTHVVVGPEQVSAGGTVTPETTRRRGRTPKISRRN